MGVMPEQLLGVQGQLEVLNWPCNVIVCHAILVLLSPAGTQLMWDSLNARFIPISFACLPLGFIPNWYGM